MINTLKDMLLIEDQSVFRLYEELIKITNYFIAPVFTISLILEFFGEMNFTEPVKKLFLVVIFMGAFYSFHTEATKIALESASITLKKVSPTNLFVKKWTQIKVKTKEQKGWDSLKSILIPNINDVIATTFFMLAKIFIWLLKLIYSSVYHLTYVFAGFTAILYFLGWTKDALKGTIQASIWCMAMLFVIVAILSLVGNSIQTSALNGELLIAKIDSIIWLFGVTLLLLISPLITYGMVRGDGIHSFGSKMGSMVVNSGLKAMALYPMLATTFKGATRSFGKSGANSFLEPPIKDLLKKDLAPDSKKLKLVESKGKIKSPFTQGRPLDQRLKSAGLTKDDAIKLSKINSTTQQTTQSSKNLKQSQAAKQSPINKEKSKMGELKSIKKSSSQPDPFLRLRKQNFKFNEKYWNGINPHKAQAIKQKYGIRGTNVDPNKVHKPIKRNDLGKEK